MSTTIYNMFTIYVDLPITLYINLDDTKIQVGRSFKILARAFENYFVLNISWRYTIHCPIVNSSPGIKPKVLSFPAVVCELQCNGPILVKHWSSMYNGSSPIYIQCSIKLLVKSCD